MRFWDAAKRLAAVVGLLLTGCGVHGIELNVDDPKSLKRAANVAKDNMMVRS